MNIFNFTKRPFLVQLIVLLGLMSIFIVSSYNYKSDEKSCIYLRNSRDYLYLGIPNMLRIYNAGGKDTSYLLAIDSNAKGKPIYKKDWLTIEKRGTDHIVTVRKLFPNIDFMIYKTNGTDTFFVKTWSLRGAKAPSPTAAIAEIREIHGPLLDPKEIAIHQIPDINTMEAHPSEYNFAISTKFRVVSFDLLVNNMVYSSLTDSFTIAQKQALKTLKQHEYLIIKDIKVDVFGEIREIKPIICKIK